jgi:hypothetical protein
VTASFTEQDRTDVYDEVLGWARSDPRVVAAAVVGSLALHPGDRWSDLDLTFGVADGASVQDVLDAWSERLHASFDAAALFDLHSGGATYRVFLLRRCLQVDLSFAPASQFGAIGPAFRLLFGRAVSKAHVGPPSARDLFGYATHHAVRARICIERGRLWQAEYWISSVRDHALSLACRRLGFPAHYGRGFDELPEGIRQMAADALVRSLDAKALATALRRSVDLLLTESGEAGDLPAVVESRLRAFVEPDAACT